MKKILSAIGLCALLGTGTVHSDECQTDCCTSGFYTCVDFLYWTAYDADLDYAANNSAASGLDVAGTNGSEAKMHFAEYDWDPAVRVIAGYRSECDGWDLRLSYLYFDSDKTSTASYGDGTNEHLKPTLWSPSFGTDRCQSASAKTELEYHLYDITVGRDCCICDNVQMRPFAGFRGMTLDQSMHVEYTGGRDFSTFTGITHWDSSFDAYGLVGGFDWKMTFCDCFTFCGTLAASVLGGETDDREYQSGPDAVGGGSQIVNNINVREEQFIGVPGYQLGLGLGYANSYDACGCCIDYKLGIGYEMHHWFNVPELRRFTGSGNEAANNGGGSKGCLMMHGLVVRACVMF